MGKIIGVHGLAGGLKLYSYAESVEWAAIGVELNMVDAAGQIQRHRVAACRPHKNVLRVVLDDVSTREQAEVLIGCGVFVEREAFPQPEEGAYYWIDVLGLEAVTPAGRILGRVREIIPTGANDVYVIRPKEDTEEGEILVPAIATVVLDIDIAGGRMVVDLPEGLE